MNRIRIVVIGCLLASMASLALARLHPFGTVDLSKNRGQATSMNNSSGLPPDLRSLLMEKCGDCHSNSPHVPLYGRFAPISWLLERDVMEARKAMNLTDWNTYEPEKRQVLLAQIIHEARSGAMPPLQYRMIHWSARISDSDLKTIASLTGEPGEGRGNSPATGPGNFTRGKELFEKRCTGCHALAANHEGPRLQGVYGRASGTLPDFAYSGALKRAHVVWNDASLERWLADPDALIPGNEMDFLVPAPQDRRDVISYLRQGTGK